MKQHGDNTAYGRPVYSVSMPDFVAFERLALPSDHTVLLIVADARNIPDETITRAAERLLGAGLVYVCVWGPDCERVHDLFDWANIGDGGKEPDFTLMSTWHNDQPLDEAIWYFTACACPLDDEWESTSYVAVTIGNSGWAAAIDSALSDVPGFKERYVGED